MNSQLDNPSQWTTGNDAPTEKQKAFISTLASQKGVSDVDPSSMNKSEASLKINELKKVETQNPDAGAGEPIQNPDTWSTGEDKATGKQTGYIAAMAREAGEKVDTEGMGKTEASKRIEVLKEKTGMKSIFSVYTDLPRMAKTLHSLPTELLLNILLFIRNSTTEDELKGFISLLTCCRQWHELAKPILWHDLVLDNKKLPIFIAKCSTTNVALIRSITLRITPETRDAAVPKPLRRQIGLTWPNIRALANLLPRVTNLAHFSLRFERLDKQPSSFALIIKPRPVTEHLIKSLPASCTSLELDLAGLTGLYYDHHLCESIRTVLPRMKHVRLNLGQVCASIITDSTSSNTYIRAPILQTLIINAHHAIPGSQLRIKACQPGLRGYWPSFFVAGSKYIAPGIAGPLSDANKAQAFPRASNISVLDVEFSRDYHPHTISLEDDFLQGLLYWQKTLVVTDILGKKTTKMPYFECADHPEVDFLRYLDSKGNTARAAFADWEILSSIAEGHAWDTTVSGMRLPGAFLASPAAQDKGYVLDKGSMNLWDQEEALQVDTKHLHESDKVPKLCRFYGREYCLSDLRIDVEHVGAQRMAHRIRQSFK